MGTTTLLCPPSSFGLVLLSLPSSTGWCCPLSSSSFGWCGLPVLSSGWCSSPSPFSGGDAFFPRSLEMVLHIALSLCLVLCSTSCIVLGSDPVPCDRYLKKLFDTLKKQRKTLGVCSFGTWRSALGTWHSEFCYVLRAECSLSTWHSVF